MSNKRKKLTKRKNQRIKTLVLATGLLICCCIVFALLFAISKINAPIYKIESRVKEIEKEKKNDIEGHETIGWLRVQGTNIDLPVVGYDNNDTFETIQKENFAWNNNKEEKLYNQVSISGHNILNLSSEPKVGKEYFSRFDDLMAFVYQDFASENKYIQYTIDGEDYLYKIFAVFFTKEYNLDLYNKNNYTKDEAKLYIEQANDLSIYDYDIDVNEKDKLITITTCSRFFGLESKKQFVVIGRMLRENEKVDNYEVKANNKYKEIEKIMKGDENNAEA